MIYIYASRPYYVQDEYGKKAKIEFNKWLKSSLDPIDKAIFPLIILDKSLIPGYFIEDSKVEAKSEFGTLYNLENHYILDTEPTANSEYNKYLSSLFREIERNPENIPQYIVETIYFNITKTHNRINSLIWLHERYFESIVYKGSQTDSEFIHNVLREQIPSRFGSFMYLYHHPTLLQVYSQLDPKDYLNIENIAHAIRQVEDRFYYAWIKDITQIPFEQQRKLISAIKTQCERTLIKYKK